MSEYNEVKMWKVALEYGLSWNQKLGVFLDEYGNFIPVSEDGQPDFEACE